MTVYKSKFSPIFFSYNYSSVSLMVGYISIFLLFLSAFFLKYDKNEGISTYLLCGCFYILSIVLSWITAYRRVLKLTIDIDNSMFVISHGAPFAPKDYLPFSDVCAVSFDDNIKANSSFEKSCAKLLSIFNHEMLTTTIYTYNGQNCFSFDSVRYSNYHNLTQIIKSEVVEKYNVKQINGNYREKDPS